MSRDYDVIVVGSGAAGLSAAIAAADAGASVLVIDADRQVGGSSRLSGGHFYAAGTRVQQFERVDFNEIPVNEPNLWRLETPGAGDWQRSPRSPRSSSSRANAHS